MILCTDISASWKKNPINKIWLCCCCDCPLLCLLYKSICYISLSLHNCTKVSFNFFFAKQFFASVFSSTIKKFHHKFLHYCRIQAWNLRSYNTLYNNNEFRTTSTHHSNIHIFEISSIIEYTMYMISELIFIIFWNMNVCYVLICMLLKIFLNWGINLQMYCDFHTSVFLFLVLEQFLEIFELILWYKHLFRHSVNTLIFTFPYYKVNLIKFPRFLFWKIYVILIMEFLKIKLNGRTISPCHGQ